MAKQVLKIIFTLSLVAALFGCIVGRNDKNMTKPINYELESVHEIDGRQGICKEDGCFFVSGSTTLSKYDKNWNLIKTNAEPFKGFDLQVNHIGDIDVYNNELYLGVEYFMDGVGKNIQVAIFDADTLHLKRVFPFKPDTGQLECSGIAVDPVKGLVYMSSWIDDESSNYLYVYELSSGNFAGKMKIEGNARWIQGVACFGGDLFITCDDGDADRNEPDHMYRLEIAADGKSCKMSLEKTFDDVKMQGEIEGLSFDGKNGKFLLLYNRGAKIIKGMPSGFYDGYDREIHEVFVYDMK